MENEKFTIDDTIVNLAYYDIIGAQILMQTMFNAAKSLHLKGDKFTPEQKRNLKKDLGFTSWAIQLLGRAQDGFKQMITALEQLSSEMDKFVRKGEYDVGMASANLLIALDLLYLDKARGSEKKDAEIHDLLLNYDGGTDGELRKVYDALMRKATALMPRA